MLKIINRVCNWEANKVSNIKELISSPLGNILVEKIGDRVVLTNNKISIEQTTEWFHIAQELGIQATIQDEYRVFTDIVFKDIPERYRREGRTNKIAIALKPFMVQEKYRIVFGFKDIAIDENGNVVKITYDPSTRYILRLEEVKQSISSAGYPRVNILDIDKDKKVCVKTYVHRLMGIAWLDTANVDFTKQSEINHKDGVKANNAISNIEWISPKGNITHAYHNNLRTDNKPVTVKNIETNKEITFVSMNDATKYMNVNLITVNRGLSNRDIVRINDKYLIKFADTKVELTLDNDRLGKPETFYTITVTFPDGHTEMFYEQAKLKQRFGYTRGFNMSDLKDKIEKDNPGVNINIEGNGKLKPVKAYNHITKELIIEPSIISMANRLNIDRRTIRSLLINRSNIKYNGIYSFAYTTDDKDLTKAELSTSRPLPIQVRNILTDEIKTFSCLKNAERDLHIHGVTLKKYLSSGEPYNSCIFTYLSN